MLLYSLDLKIVEIETTTWKSLRSIYERMKLVKQEQELLLAGR